MSRFQNELNVQTFDTDEAIFSTGDPGDCMYGVVEGSVAIMLDGETVETLSEGDFFGEMAVIDKSDRSAEARALTPCRLARIDHDRFIGLVRENPVFAIKVMRVLTKRLRRRDTDS